MPTLARSSCPCSQVCGRKRFQGITFLRCFATSLPPGWRPAYRPPPAPRSPPRPPPPPPPRPPPPRRRPPPATPCGPALCSKVQRRCGPHQAGADLSVQCGVFATTALHCPLRAACLRRSACSAGWAPGASATSSSAYRKCRRAGRCCCCGVLLLLLLLLLLQSVLLLRRRHRQGSGERNTHRASSSSWWWCGALWWLPPAAAVDAQLSCAAGDLRCRTKRSAEKVSHHTKGAHTHRTRAQHPRGARA